MTALHFVLPGDPATRTGGFRYDARMIEGLRAAGRAVVVHALPADFPFPCGATREAAASLLAGLPSGAAVVVDGLGYGALPELALQHSQRLRLIALVHHPLAAETGLDRRQQERLFESERAALAAARGVITSSDYTARGLEAYGVAPKRIRVAEPGVDPAPLARGSGGGTAVLLCVATLTPRKGHAVLIEALAELADRPWRLVCAGSRSRDPETARRIENLLCNKGLSERVRLLGEIGDDALAAAYDGADLFVSASHYEGYGMVLTEALARGLPLVATRAGASAETLPDDAALLVPPGEPDALSTALARVLGDTALRESLAAGARRARSRLTDWPTAARRIADALDTLLA